MFLSFEEVQDLIEKLNKTDFHSAFSTAWKFLEVDSEVKVFEDGQIKMMLERHDLFKDSSVAPINPAMPKQENILLVTMGSRNIGRFVVSEHDTDFGMAESFNFTIAESVTAYIKEDYFGNWFRQNLGPLMAREIPYNQALEMVQSQLANFGVQCHHIFDGTHLNITVFKEEPFEVIWAITHNSSLPKNLNFYPQGFLGLMAFEVFKHIFFEIANGMGTSYEIKELS